MLKDRLKELREKADLSQQALADKLFVSRSAIAKWENGNGIPSDVNIETICSFFNVDKDYLFGEILISEYREVTNKNIKYKKTLILTFLISCCIIVSIVTIGIIKKNIDERDYERYKEWVRQQVGFNEPVESFGNVEESFLEVINDKILHNDENVFLNEKDFYVVNQPISNYHPVMVQDFAEIARYDYNFNLMNKFDYFLHNGIASTISQILTTNDNGILIVCNRSTYYENDWQYRGYSKITKYDENYNVSWEYTFINGENSLNAVFELNDVYYIFSTCSEFSETKSATLPDIKIYVLSQDGKLIKEKNVTTNECGSIKFVKFENDKFYISGYLQENYDTIFRTWEYDMNLNLLNNYDTEKFWSIKTYKTQSGIMFYDNNLLNIVGVDLSNKYGEIELCIDLEKGHFLVFKNVIDYGWDNFPANVSHIPRIIQTIYLYIDTNGNILWCKSVY